MSLKLRLARHGAKKRPYYRIVVADARAPRDGRYIDRIGSYNPLLNKDDENRIVIDVEKAKDWIAKGARPTERVARFLGGMGLWEWTAGNNPEKGKPGAKALQLIKDREDKDAARKEAEEEAKTAAKEAAQAAKDAEKAAAEAPAEEAPAAEEATAPETSAEESSADETPAEG